MIHYGIAFVFFLVSNSLGRADLIVEFRLDDLGVLNTTSNTLTVLRSGLSDSGVMFDATLNVTGASSSGSGFVGYNGTGAGIDGNTLDGSNGRESLRFSISISNMLGGIAAFNGFQTLSLSGFGINDSGVISLDNLYSTGGDNETLSTGGTLGSFSFPSAQIAFQPAAFSIFSNSGEHFQVSRLSATFSGTAAAVPEPASIGLIAGIFCGIALRSGRRKLSRQVSAISDRSCGER
jgi:hypothetical protein